MTEQLSLIHRLWRALPAGYRRAALDEGARALAPRRGAVPEASQGLAVAGEVAGDSGLAEAARVMADSVRLLGYGGETVTLGVGRVPQGVVPPESAVLLMVNAPSLPLMLARAPRTLLRGRRVIGYWAWELPVVPQNWARGLDYLHEVWVPSNFVARALAPVVPQGVRVVPFPLGLRGVAHVSPDRLGVPPEIVRTTMVLSLGSGFARKNPLAGIAAFKRAFGARRDQILVVKLNQTWAYPREAAAILAQAAPNVRVIAESWPLVRVQALLEASDIVLSLHRAEGFGLVPAEAMLRGKPVVATGWSGNMAYMDESSAALVPYTLVPVRDEGGIYPNLPGALWAEPDIDAAAAWLRRLGEDADLRAKLGARGRAGALAKLGQSALLDALTASNIGIPVGR